MASGNVLGFYIPKQQNVDIDAPYLRPKDVDKWIKELPLAHIGESSRLIFKALVESNRVAVPVNQRFKLLESLRGPVEHVIDSLSKYYLGQPLPTTIKNQKIADLTKELNWEMSIGYKIILEAAMSGFAQRVDQKTLTTTLHRAMYYLSQSIIKSYEIYKSPPERAWLETHHLYFFAEHNRLHTEEIKDPVHKHAGSIRTLYLQIVLLAVANPLRLPQREIGKVYRLLKDWASHTEIRPLEQHSSSAGLFSVDLEKDAPPAYFDSKAQMDNPSHIRIIDTSSLTRVLRDQLDNINREAEQTDHAVQHLENRLHHDTLRRLLMVWGAVPRRNFSRQGKNINADISLGLNAIHFLIEKLIAHKTETSIAEKAHRDVLNQLGISQKANFDTPSDETLSIPWEHSNEPRKLLSSVGELPPIQSPFSNSTRETFESETAQHDTYPCLLVNQSAGGFCLNWKSDATTKTSVGTLIGIQSPDKDSRVSLTIGVIRWLKLDNQTQLFFGVEILAPYAQPVIIKSISRKTESAPFMRSLLLPEARSINQPQTLITPPLFRVGDRLRVDVAGQIVKVKLTKLLESTATFSQFQFHILKSNDIASETDKLDRIKNFDSLWSAI